MACWETRLVGDLVVGLEPGRDETCEPGRRRLSWAELGGHAQAPLDRAERAAPEENKSSSQSSANTHHTVVPVADLSGERYPCTSPTTRMSTPGWRRASSAPGPARSRLARSALISTYSARVAGLVLRNRAGVSENTRNPERPDEVSALERRGAEGCGGKGTRSRRLAWGDAHDRHCGANVGCVLGRDGDDLLEGNVEFRRGGHRFSLLDGGIRDWRVGECSEAVCG